jgi:hypothetical protein
VAVAVVLDENPPQLTEGLRSVAGGIAIAEAAQLLATGEQVEAAGFCGEIAAAMRPYETTFSDLVEELPSRLEEDREAALHAVA